MKTISLPPPCLLRIVKYYLSYLDDLLVQISEELRYSGLSPRDYPLPGKPEGDPQLALMPMGAGRVYITGVENVDVQKLIRFIEKYDRRASHSDRILISIEPVEEGGIERQLTNLQGKVFAVAASVIQVEEVAGNAVV